MQARTRRRTTRTVALVVMALAGAVGAASAGLDGVVESGVVNACRHKSGFLLVPSPGKGCKKSERASAGGELLDALSYEGPITSAVVGAETYNLVEGTVLPAAVADSNTVTGSLARTPDGRDTDDASSDWVFTTTVTPGAPNVSG